MGDSNKFNPLSISCLVDDRLDKRHAKITPVLERSLNSSGRGIRHHSTQFSASGKQPTPDIAANFLAQVFDSATAQDSINSNPARGLQKSGTDFVLSSLKKGQEEKDSSFIDIVEFSLNNTELGEVRVKGKRTCDRLIEVKVELPKSLPWEQVQALREFLTRQLSRALDIQVEVEIAISTQRNSSRQT